MKKKIFPGYKIIGKLILVLGVLAVLFAISLSAAEKAKIKLPDGIYMCNSNIERFKDGSMEVNFAYFFLVQNNTIYSSLEALKKFGVVKLNKLFTEKKNFKLLSGGENIGRLYQVEVKEDGQLSFETELSVKEINKYPMYGEPGGLGSVSRCIAVPEKYKEKTLKGKNTLSKEEVEKISKLIKEKLFDLAKQRREFTQSYSEETLKSYAQGYHPLNYKDAKVDFEELKFLDKVSRQNDEIYIGLYWYHFQGARVLQIVFSARKDTLSIITTDHDEETLEGSEMTVLGMLDVDGCGEGELIVQKNCIEIYKQKADGNWTRIQKIKEDDFEWRDYRRSQYDAKITALAKKYAKNIKLPDGLYMYDSWITKLTDGDVKIHFQKLFIAINNTIYLSQEAIRKFGTPELKRLFTENKKYKILFGGKQIGTIYDIEIINEKGDWKYKKELLDKNIKEGPAYGSGGHGHGSAVTCIAVPEEYKEVKKKVYTTIPMEEVEKIARLAKEKLLPLLINRKGFAKYKITEMELYKDSLMHLDKISYRNDELYIGRYLYAFKTPKRSYWFDIIFSAKKDNFHVVTTDYEEGDLVAGYMTIYGMLDVDGCGEDELVIEKEAPREDETTIWLEIHKQKADGNWTRITVNKTRRIL